MYQTGDSIGKYYLSFKAVYLLLNRTRYWAVTAIFTVATLAFLIAGILTQRRSMRTLYYLSALSSYAGCLAYFAMGADLGWVAVQVEFPQGAETRVSTPTRQVYWVRYILWLEPLFKLNRTCEVLDSVLSGLF